MIPADCHPDRPHCCKGKCRACYQSASRKRPCRRCGVHPANRPRRLCWACYHTPGVREQYGILPGAYPRDHEPTTEELDAMIAEQLRPENLPPWWPKTEGIDHDD